MPILERASIGSWHLINHRRAKELLVAEFLHLLHERHNPFVNPTRVSTTLVEFSPWQANSYTPLRDWQLMVRRTADRFLLDPARRAADLEASLRRPRDRTRDLISRCAATTLADCSDVELADRLIDAVYVPLGDIYEINLVQVEAGLEAAIVERVQALVPGLDVVAASRLVGRLVLSEVRTEIVEEESEFIELVHAHRHATQEKMAPLLESRARDYVRRFSGYGAVLPSAADLWHRYVQYDALSSDELARRLGAGSASASADDAMVADLRSDDTIRELATVMRLLGETRDRNKALLGRVTPHRDAIVAEIADRADVHGADAALMSLEELCALAVERRRVPPQLLDLRRRQGVVFGRDEYFGAVNQKHRAAGAGTLSPHPGETVLTGLAASAGEHEGRAFVVAGRHDVSAMRMGDVLVAAGTDFDLALLLTLAGAVVTEEGGMLSHAAVVARERQVPCVQRVAGATSRIRTGDQVRVSADEGKVVVVRDEDRVSRSLAGPVGRDARALLTPTPDHRLDEIGRKASTLLLLEAAGFPVVSLVRVVSIPEVRGMRELTPSGRRAVLEALADDACEVFDGPLIIRSSSVLEDGEDGTAAGIYTSVADVPLDREKVADAMATVIDSGRSQSATAYFADGDSDRAASDVAVILAPYLNCELLGTAMYPSPWRARHALVEAFEPGPDDADSLPTQLVELPTPARPPGSLDEPVTMSAALGMAADYARRLHDQLGGPAELEFGLHEGRFYVFQGRPLSKEQHGWRSEAPEGTP